MGENWFEPNAKRNVGAGLLAKAVSHSTLMLADTPPSRASPLPHFNLRSLLLLHQGGTRRLVSFMLILVQRGRQFEVEFLVLRIDGLWRQQRDLAIFQQLENTLDLERGWPTGKLAFLAALLDRDSVDGVLAHKRRHLSSKDFDVRGFVVIVEGDFLGVQRDVAQGLIVEGSHSNDGFAAFDFDAADFHLNPFTG